MKNSKIICKILNIKNIKQINPKDVVAKYTWDSMSMITLIALIEDKYKKKIKVSNIRSIKTIQDLDDVISKTVK